MSKHSDELEGIAEGFLKYYEGKTIIADRYDDGWKNSKGSYGTSNEKLIRLFRKFDFNGDECETILDLTTTPKYAGPVLKELRCSIPSRHFYGVITPKSGDIATDINDAFGDKKVISPSDAYIDRLVPNPVFDIPKMINDRNWIGILRLATINSKTANKLFLTSEETSEYDAEMCKHKKVIYSTILYQLLSYSTKHNDINGKDLEALSLIVKALESTDILSVSLETREFKNRFVSRRSDQTTSSNGYLPDYVKKLGELTNHRR